MAHLGQSLVSPRDRRSGITDHLWVVLSNVTEDGRVVIANVSSRPCPSGETCTIEAGEHPFIKHRSYVRFLEARVRPAAAIDQLVGAGTATRQPNLAAPVLKRLQKAIAGSAVVERDAIQILREQGFA